MQRIIAEIAKKEAEEKQERQKQETRGTSKEASAYISSLVAQVS